MEVEHDVKVIPIDENLQAEVQKLATEGWEMVAGVKPVAVYHVARVKRPSAGAGFGKLHIDDSKVGILKPDGTMQ